MSYKILITGASGFVGACLAEDLVKQGKNVAVVTRDINTAWRLNKIKNDVEVFNIDLCDENSVDKMINVYRPNRVFHLATYGGYYFQSEDKKILTNNIFGTFNLVNSVTKRSFDSFINVSSSSEYGTKSLQMNENDVLEPINVYGVSKSTATLYCRMLSQNNRLPIATIRLFSPYGYYEDKTRLVSSVVLSCIQDKKPKLASGEAVRDFIFIEDAINMLKQVSLSKNLVGKIYNCGTGKQHSVKEMVDTIIRISGKELMPEWGSADGRKSDTNKWEADMTLVNNDIKWVPKYSLKEGLIKSYEWYQENIGLYKI